MSISNPIPESPVKKFLEFKSEKENFFFWNKETKESIIVNKPFYFLVMDETSMITGYNDQLACGLYSNGIHDLKNEILTVRSFKKGIEIVGKYQDIKDKVTSKSIGGRFTKTIWCLLITGKQSCEMIAINLSGSAFASWMDKDFDTRKSIVKFEKTVEKLKGNKKYFAPVFEAVKMNDYFLQEAIKQDKILQDYFRAKKSQSVEKAEAEITNEDLHEGPPADVPEKEVDPMMQDFPETFNPPF